MFIRNLSFLFATVLFGSQVSWANPLTKEQQIHKILDFLKINQTNTYLYSGVETEFNQKCGLLVKYQVTPSSDHQSVGNESLVIKVWDPQRSFTFPVTHGHFKIENRSMKVSQALHIPALSGTFMSYVDLEQNEEGRLVSVKMWVGGIPQLLHNFLPAEYERPWDPIECRLDESQ